MLAVPAEVFQQPLVDESGKTVRLGPFDLRRAPVDPLLRMQDALPVNGTALKPP